MATPRSRMSVRDKMAMFERKSNVVDDVLDAEASAQKPPEEVRDASKASQRHSVANIFRRASSSLRDRKSIVDRKPLRFLSPNKGKKKKTATSASPLVTPEKAHLPPPETPPDAENKRRGDMSPVRQGSDQQTTKAPPPRKVVASPFCSPVKMLPPVANDSVRSPVKMLTSPVKPNSTKKDIIHDFQRRADIFTQSVPPPQEPQEISFQKVSDFQNRRDTFARPFMAAVPETNGAETSNSSTATSSTASTSTSATTSSFSSSFKSRRETFMRTEVTPVPESDNSKEKQETVSSKRQTINDFKSRRESFARSIVSPVKLLPFQNRGNDEQKDVTSLRKEVTELRHRIKILDTDTGRNELLELVKAREEENREKDEKVKHLNEKLSRIQKGLSDIEEERKTLTARANRLEIEKATLKKELKNRELEIQTLTKRCADQMEKVTESNLLRAANKELTESLKQANKSLADLKDNSAVSDLQKELENTKKERAELFKRFLSVKNDHDKVTASLRECVENLQHLAQEKRSWEEEKKHLAEQAAFELEEQRLSHQQETIVLEEDLRLKDGKLKSTEQLAKQRDDIIQILQNQIIESEAVVEDQRLKSQEEYQKRMDSLKDSHQAEISRLRASFEAALKERQVESQESTTERDETIQALEKMCSELRDNFSADKLRMETKFEESKTALLKRHEEEMNKLQQKFESEITELRSALESQQKEKEQLSAETSGSLGELRTQLSEKQALHEAQLKAASDTHQEEITKIHSEYKDGLSLLREDLEALAAENKSVAEEKDAVIRDLQKQLEETKALAKAENEAVLRDEVETIVSKIKGEMNEITKEHGDEVNSLKNEMKTAAHESEGAIRERDTRIESLQTQLNALQESSKLEAEERHSKMINVHREEITSIRSQHETEVNAFQTRLDVISKENDRLCSERDRAHTMLTESNETLASRTREFQAQLTGSSSRHQKELEGLRKRYEDEISNLQAALDTSVREAAQSCSEQNQEISSLQRQLSDATKALASTTRELQEEIASVTSAHLLELSSLQNDHNDELALLQAKLDTAKEDNRRLCDDKDGDVSRLMTQLEECRTELSLKEATWKSDVDAHSSRHEADLSELREQLEGEIASLRTQLEETMESGQKMQTEQEEGIEDLRSQLSQSNRDHDSTKSELQNKIAELTSGHEAQLLSIRCLHDTEVSSLTAKLEDTILDKNRSATEKDQTLERLRQQLSAANDTIKLKADEFEARISEISANHERDISELNRQRDEEVAKLQNSIEELAKKTQMKVDTDESTIQSLQAEVTQSKALCSKTGKEIEALITTHQNEIDTIHRVYEDELSALKNKVDDRTFVIRALEQDISAHMEKLMVANSELQKLQEDSKLVDDLAADIEALEMDRCSLTEILYEKDVEIAEISAEILKLEIEKALLEQDSKKLLVVSKRLESVENQTDLLTTGFQEEREKLQKTIQELKEDVEDAHAETSRLQDIVGEYREEVASLKLKMRTTETDRKQTRQKTQGEISSLKKEMDRKAESILNLQEALRQSKEAVNAATRRMEDSEETATSLRRDASRRDKEISDLRLEMANTLVEHQKESTVLKEETRDLKTQLALKADEVRELRVVELYEKQEAIALLEREKISLMRDVASKSEFADKISTELGAEIQQLRSKLAEMESRAAERNQSSQADIDRHLKTISDQKRETDFLQIQLQDKDRKMEEATTEIETLSKRLEEAGHQKEKAREECRLRRVAEDELRRECDKLTLRLSQETEERVSHECLVADLQQERDDLREQVKICRGKVTGVEEKVTSLKAEIQERSELVNELAGYNKDLEGKLKTRAEESDRMDEEVNALLHELRSKDILVERLQKECKEIENTMQDQIDAERNMHDIALADLETAQEKILTLSQDAKDIVELEKENGVLKDKVRRQEAFLKRKLEKEKVLRVRTTAQASAVKQPRNGGRSTPRGITINTESTTSTSQSLLDWELENLLAD